MVVLSRSAWDAAREEGVALTVQGASVEDGAEARAGPAVEGGGEGRLAGRPK